MSAPNFWTMENFPLYVKSDREFYIAFCPDCDCWCCADDTEDGRCPECGAELEREEYDYAEAEAFFDNVNEKLDEINAGLTFYKIELRCGYYSDSQFYVDLTEAADCAGFSEPDDPKYGPDNESCRYWLDMCRSEALRKHDREIRKVNKLLEQLADEFEFDRLGCLGVFSNGEAVYQIEKRGGAHSAA